MKRLSTLLLSSTVALLTATAGVHTDKAVYIPRDLEAMDLDDPASKWCWQRSASTPNVILFWAGGFGDDIGQAPSLEGTDMTVDMSRLLSSLERFYSYFYHDLAFVKPGTKADKYKMMVMLDYSLEGTAYGGDYDEEIGALWVTPNRLKDPRLNCIAHELGHSFQSQISSDGEGEAWGGHGIFEMTSQWMLWRVNPDWPTDENYHLRAFRDNTSKAFLHIENIYRSPYILEYWAQCHGDKFIAELFRQGRRGEDPVMTYIRLTGMNQAEFVDDMFEGVKRLANWDLNHARANMRRYADIWDTPLVKNGKWLQPDSAHVPEDYGFNIVPLEVPAPGHSVSIDFQGLTHDSDGSKIADPKSAGWRYCVVAVDRDGNARYTPVHSAQRGSIKYTTPTDGNIDRLWLVVMGAPTTHRQLPRLYVDEDLAPEDDETPDRAPAPNRRWPWRFKTSYK